MQDSDSGLEVILWSKSQVLVPTRLQHIERGRPELRHLARDGRVDPRRRVRVRVLRRLRLRPPRLHRRLVDDPLAVHRRLAHAHGLACEKRCKQAG